MKLIAANIKEGEWDWLQWAWKVRWWITAGFFAFSLILIMLIIILKGNS